MSEKIIRMAKVLCEKFINKVETGRARSHETYAECKALLKTINETNNAMHSDGQSDAAKDIWTNEDESAEIEQQIIEDARR